MRGPLCQAVNLVVLLMLVVPVSAQFGHPLKGSWTGDWSPGAGKQTHVLVVLNWDGKAITGTVNPGPNGVALSKATLDGASWNVHLEADGKDTTGKPVHYAMDAKLENIGSFNRVMSGTWTDGALKGAIKLTRN